MGVVVAFALVVVATDDAAVGSDLSVKHKYLLHFGYAMYFPRRVSGTSVDVILGCCQPSAFFLHLCTYATQGSTRVVGRTLMNTALQPPCRLLGI